MTRRLIRTETTTCFFNDASGAEADTLELRSKTHGIWPVPPAPTTRFFSKATRFAEMLQAFYGFIGTNQMMAYLVMMAARIKELHRVPKPNGSLYLHCDSPAFC